MYMYNALLDLIGIVMQLHECTCECICVCTCTFDEQMKSSWKHGVDA